VETNSREFEQIYSDYQPKVHRYLTRLVGAKEAEDLTQEVFLKVSKALSGFRNDAQLSTWIYKIATNTAIDRIRMVSFKQTNHNQLNEDFEEIVKSVPGGQLVDQQVVRNEMNECINAYIETLPEKYRTILILSEIEGLKNQEIAEITDLNIGIVKIRLHRAKEKIKQILLEKCNFYQTSCCGKLACEPIGPIPKRKNQ
jgi:RNA polymerase sigma-70 factor (ECF subfamily)